MLEVNRELLRAAARTRVEAGDPHPLVISAATWGRGCRQEVLRDLEPYRHAWGFNSSLVATPPRDFAAQLLDLPELQHPVSPGLGHFQGLGVAYGKTHSEWLLLDEADDDELF